MRKLLFTIVALLLCTVGAWAGTDVTAWYIGDLSHIINGGGHNCSNNHKLSNTDYYQNNADGWWNTQTIKTNAWHAFVAPGTSGTGESWTSEICSQGVMMGRTIVLPAGNYTLSFKAFACNATNSETEVLPSAGDAVAFLTDMDDIDITNTQSRGDTTFHNVSFTFDVTTNNKVIDFGIKKLTDESIIDWCQIKEVNLTLNSTNLVAIPNNSTDNWTDGLEVNTASTEGCTDNTYFLPPFIQKWVNSANSATLSNGTYKKSYTPTENGFYKVNAWVRLYKESASQTPYSGATMYAGSNSNSVSVCSGGTLYNDNKVHLGSYSVKIVGTKDVAFDYGFTLSSANFNWLAFKNITIEKVATLDDFADALPGSAVTAGLWYKFTTGSSSDAYTLSSSGDATITYTTDGTLTNDAGVSDTWSLHAKQNVLLAPNTTYYVKSSAAVTLTKAESSVNSSYISGWTKVTSISQLQTNPDDYFFAIFSANNTGVMLGASGNYADTQKPYYKTAANPLSNIAYLFQIENYDGGFVLKSTSIGKYFNNTSGAPWNYHANATSTSSDCKITATLANGVYTLQTANADGGAGNYLGLWYAGNNNMGYVDGEYLAGNKPESAKGSFLIYRIAKSAINNVDMTSAITNPDFSATTWSNGWTGCITDKQTKADAFADQSGNSNFSGHFAEMWVPNGTPMSLGDLNQTINNLPAGVYTLSAKIQAGITCKLYAAVTGQSEQYLEYNGSVANKSFRFLVNSDNAVKIGLKHDGVSSPSVDVWVAVDDFQLVYEGCLPSDADKTSFSTALSSANAKVLGFEVGEYAPYENVDAINARITANGLVIDKYTKDELTSATTTLTSATWTANDAEVNAIAGGIALDNYTNDGSYDQPNGWTNTGYNTRIVGISESLVEDNPGLAGATNERAILVKYETSYGGTTGYTMPLKANTLYKFSFTYGLWNEGGEIRKNLTVTAPDASTIQMTPNYVSKNEGDADKCANKLTTAWYSGEAYFTTTDAGNYTLNIVNYDAGNQRQMVFADLEVKRANITIDETETYANNLEGIANVTLNRTIQNGGKWNTFVVPFSISNEELTEAFGADVAVAEYSERKEGDESIIKFQIMETPAISANTPVLLRTSTAGTSYEFTNRTLNNSSAIVEGTGDFDFVGSYEDEKTLDDTDYFISNNTLYQSNGKSKVRGTRAYIHAKTSSARVAQFIIEDEDQTTGIQSVKPVGLKDQPLYNLNGQRIENTKKGIYIKQGKKIVIK